MNSRREEYLEIKRRNRARLVVAIVASIIIILFSYLVLKPKEKQKLAENAGNEATVTIAGQNDTTTKPDDKKTVSESNLSNEPNDLSDEDAFKLAIFQNAVEEGKKLAGGVIDKSDELETSEKEESIAGEASPSNASNDSINGGYNSINHLVPLVPVNAVDDSQVSEQGDENQAATEKKTADIVKPVKQQEINTKNSTQPVKQETKINQVTAVNKEQVTAVDKGNNKTNTVATDLSKEKSDKTTTTIKQTQTNNSNSNNSKPEVTTSSNIKPKSTTVEKTTTKPVTTASVKTDNQSKNTNNKSKTTNSTTTNSQNNKKTEYKSTPQATSQAKGREKIMTVQVASLSDPIQAQALKSELAGKGYPARVERYKNGNQTLYRVRVGVYNNRDEASKVVSKLQSSGYSAAISR
ncbi:hypothetical protein GKC56_06435 [Neisseriaceae bacterium PsAf]|nr:hypothetical protein [Neisseriaceae bacterium PsAf]